MLASQATPVLIKREWARRHLSAFAASVYPDYVSGAHITKLCECLEAVERRDINRLMVFMPPRHSKSIHVSQLFPCWYLGRNPTHEIVQASYGSPLSLKHSRAARDFFVSQTMQDIFPSVHHAPERAGQNAVDVTRQAAGEWGTRQGGHYYAVGVGGALTGRGFNLGIVDDPHKDRQEADSEIYRDGIWNWWQSTFYTRRNPGAAIILTQTRWHPDDLAGRLMEQEKKDGGDKWHKLDLPAIDDEGRPLWPDRWPATELAKIKIAVGPREWAALYQQRPTEPGGSIFQRNWWFDNRYDFTDQAHTNSCVARVISWDTAEKIESGHAYSAGAVGELTPGRQALLRDMRRGRWKFPDLCQQIEAFAQRYRFDDKLKAVLIEDKSSGTAILQTLRSQGPHWLRKILFAVNPRGDKVQRAHAASAWCVAGIVWLPLSDESCVWLHDFEEELFSFPASTYKDQVDAFTQLLWYWHHILAAGLGVERYA